MYNIVPRHGWQGAVDYFHHFFGAQDVLIPFVT